MFGADNAQPGVDFRDGDLSGVIPISKWQLSDLLCLREGTC